MGTFIIINVSYPNLEDVVKKNLKITEVSEHRYYIRFCGCISVLINSGVICAGLANLYQAVSEDLTVEATTDSSENSKFYWFHLQMYIEQFSYRDHHHGNIHKRGDKMSNYSGP